MYCKHCGTYSCGKYCPNCGKRVFTSTEDNLREYRRIEKSFERLRPDEFNGAHHLRYAAWTLAEDKVLGLRKRMLNIYDCPPGLAGQVMERAQIIYERLVHALDLPAE